MAWEKLITRNATVYDTVALIIRTINDYAGSPVVIQVRRIIEKKYHTDEQFLKGLFDFVCEYVDYEKDPAGDEKVMTPQRLLREGKGDCKKMTTFISAVLRNKGIKNYLKIVSYDGQAYNHIYVIVPLISGGYITLDPVNNCRYDAEVRHKKSETYNLQGKKMNLSQLGRMAQNDTKDIFNNTVAGIADLDNDLMELSGPEDFLTSVLEHGAEMSGQDDDDEMDGMGKRKKKTPEQKAAKKQKRKEKVKKLVGKVKKVGLAPGRIAFIGLVSINFVGWAKKLAFAWNEGKGKVGEFWKKLGGDPAQLKKAIEKGSKQSLGAVPAAAAIAALPVITAFLVFLKESKLLAPKDAKALEEAKEELEKEEEKEGEGEEKPAPLSIWFSYWSNPIDICMNILRINFILGVDYYIHGPLTTAWTLLYKLF